MPINSQQNLTENEDENLLKDKQNNTTNSEKSLYFQNLLSSPSTSSSLSLKQQQSQELEPQPSTSAGLLTRKPSTENYKKFDDIQSLDETQPTVRSVSPSNPVCKTSLFIDQQNEKSKFAIKRKLSLGVSYITPKKKYSSQEAEIKNFGAPIATAKLDEKKEQFKVALPPPQKEVRVRKRVGIPVEDPSVALEKIAKMSVFDRRYHTDSSVNGYVSSSRGSSSTTSSHNDEIHSSNQILNNHHYSSQPMQTNASTPSMATLCNIGNSCYLNSVVYTLRFAPLFLHNLHHLIDDLAFIQKQKSVVKTASLGRNIPGLGADLENIKISDNDGLTFQMSSHQIATVKLHELYQSLHRNEVNDISDPFHTDTFLNAIQKVSSIFEGNQQQDAHEFLMCVLDNIRETCQMLIKEIMNYPEVFFNISSSHPESQTDLSSAFLENLNTQNPYPSGSTSSISSGSSIIKNISRKFNKKKDESSTKLLRLNSPLKDTVTYPSESSMSITNNTADSVDSGFVGTTNVSKLTLTPTPEEESRAISTNDKDRILERVKKLGLDFFSEDFEGITVASTKCLTCETVTEQKETMINIAVPVPSSGYDCADYTQDKSSCFIQNSCITREYFRGENKYRCEQCTGYTEAIRSISFEVLPRLLVIQLSRFSGGMEKINSYIPTPFTLQCFCSKCCELGDNEKLHVYKLYSVITHVGATMSVGHYIAYTCSLDWATEYKNCPKDKLKKQKQQQEAHEKNQHIQNLQPYEKNVGKFKKIFSRSKTSSSSDMSKGVSTTSTNGPTVNGGSEKPQNTICPGIKCCGIELKNNLPSTNASSSTTQPNGGINHNGYYEENDEFGSNPNWNYLNGGGSSGSTPTGAGGGAGPGSKEPIWYMCDDDKIKTMTQREFEDLLSPNRKITVTPYLLFYARSDLQ
ncbi:USP1 family protein [Megaselia abdita]